MIATIYCINISYQYFVSIVTMIKWLLIAMAVILCVNILTVNLRLCPPPYSADSKPPQTLKWGPDKVFKGLGLKIARWVG